MIKNNYMTRINVGVDPKELPDKLLLAEHREIKRLPSNYKKRLEKNDFSGIPDTFRLGAGHVNFFLNKGFYTFCRYLQIYIECKKRGFNIQDYSDNWSVYNEEHWGGYIATEIDRQLITQRIKDRGFSLVINKTE